MNTYRWTCLACKSPNVLVHDESKEGQIALNCKQCGEPGVFEPEEQRIRMSPGYPEAYTPVISTCSTDMMIDSARSIAEAGAPRIKEVDYADPTRVVKKSPHWRV